MKYLLLFAIALGLPLTMARAEGTFEVSPFAGLRFGGSFLDYSTGEEASLDSSLSYGLTMDITLPELGSKRQLEVLYSHQDTSFQAQEASTTQSFDISVDAIQIGLLQEFAKDDDKLRPFLVGLVGATYMYGDEGSDAMFSFGLGGGVKYFPLKNVGLRLDLRGYPTFVSGSTAAICSGGCIIGFSGSMMIQGEIAASLVIRF